MLRSIILCKLNFNIISYKLVYFDMNLSDRHFIYLNIFSESHEENRRNQKQEARSSHQKQVSCKLSSQMTLSLKFLKAAIHVWFFLQLVS